VFRKNGMPVFLVPVVTAPEMMLKIESALSFSRSGPLLLTGMSLFRRLLLSHQTSRLPRRRREAFYDTDLELPVRKAGEETILLCGIATDIGVESTARFMCEYGFQQVFIEDTMSLMSAEQHHAAGSFNFGRQAGCGKPMKYPKATGYLSACRVNKSNTMLPTGPCRGNSANISTRVNKREVLMDRKIPDCGGGRFF
jgi:hypothetical protein